MNVKETADFIENVWFEKRGLISAALVVLVSIFPFVLINAGLLVAIISTVAIEIAVARYRRPYPKLNVL